MFIIFNIPGEYEFNSVTTLCGIILKGIFKIGERYPVGDQIKNYISIEVNAIHHLLFFFYQFFR